VGAEAAARALQWEFHTEYAHDDRGLEMAFARLAVRGVGGLVVLGDPFFNGRRARIVELAARYAIPASYFFRDFVLEGGLSFKAASASALGKHEGKQTARSVRISSTISGTHNPENGNRPNRLGQALGRT
jgi:putative tryptophan/tyrosine transport system substrate-binding protein